VGEAPCRGEKQPGGGIRRGLLYYITADLLAVKKSKGGLI